MEKADYANHMRRRGFRATPQRLVILEILDRGCCHYTPTQVYELAQVKLPGLSEATVYRTLSFLTEQGLALCAHVGNGQLVYESALRQHHHLLCRRCGGEIEIEHADLAPLYEKLEEETGFQITTTHLTFFGLCPPCQKE